MKNIAQIIETIGDAMRFVRSSAPKEVKREDTIASELHRDLLDAQRTLEEVYHGFFMMPIEEGYKENVE